MLFNSLDFLLLLAITLGCYYFPPLRRIQILILISASFVFYGYSHPWLLSLLILSCAVNAVSSYRVYWGTIPSRQKLWAAAGVSVNLSLLLFFKYSKLIYSSLGQDLSRTDGIGAFLISIPLPIGISFFTFQGISLVVDTFRWKRKGETKSFYSPNFFIHLYNTTFFKAFFPQLIAGPIVKAHQFLPQIGLKSLRDVRWESAFKSLVTGYFLKMVIADNLKDQTFWIAAPYFQNLASPNLVLMLLGYSMQIFADFAGYSLIAMGLAELFGYRLPINFNFPYISRSFSEFWTRWHISLSTWLREYLYIPLGGNRKGPARTYLNLFCVMFLGGLWHGATWSYAVWGTFHGLLLAAERFLIGGKESESGHWLIDALRTILVFGMVTLAWLLFKLPRFEDALFYLQSIGRNTHLAISKTAAMIILLYSLPVAFYHFHHLYRRTRPLVGNRDWSFLAYGTMLFFLVVNSGVGGDFIYFQF